MMAWAQILLIFTVSEWRKSEDKAAKEKTHANSVASLVCIPRFPESGHHPPTVLLVRG